jgi:hypothetical protein
MKKINILLLTLITSSLLQANTDDINQPLHGKTFLAPRSESVNAARELVLWHRYINQYCQDFYGAFSVTPEYKHSFRPNRLAEYFWAVDELVIAGSQVPNRTPEIDILADYFGLSPSFESTVTMDPQIRTGLIDFDVYLGYQDYYLRAHIPYVWTKWTYEFNEVITQGTPNTAFPAGYMDVGPVTPPATSFTQAINGGLSWGQVRALEFGRIDKPKGISGFAEAQIALGWNFINTPLAHAGINIRGSVPAGTRSKAIYLFEPIIGNGHHPEFGVGFTSHAMLWEKDGQQNISIFCDINLTHLFNSRQRRSFDLINPEDRQNLEFQGFATRYILAKQFLNGVYTGITVPAIDITTLECDVSVAIQVDAVIMASYEYCGYTADLGYNAWFRSREMISNREPIPNNTYALKGIQNVAGPGPLGAQATQSNATIFGNDFADRALVADLNPPVFFNDSMIDDNSAQASRGFTHKLFGNFGYTWNDCMHWISPFFGIGGEVEFEGLNPRQDIKANKNSISQWGVWLKTGFAF